MHSGSKSEQVLEDLRKQIMTGGFADGRLPREVDLCQTYGVARVTLRKALAVLEGSRLIERRKRAGTFVIPQPAPGQSTIGLLMRTQGHLFSDMYGKLSERLAVNGYSALCVNMYTGNGVRRTTILRKADQLMSLQLSGFIVDGYILGELPSLACLQVRQPVLWNFYDAPTPLQTTGVWFDFEQAGYLGGKFLMERGCRRPLLLLHPLPLAVRFNPGHYHHHRERQIMLGYCRALAEYGLEGEHFVCGPHCREEKGHFELIIKMIHNRQLRPDGIFGSADSLLVRPMRTAAALKVRPGRDLHFVGIGNTPWSSQDSMCPFSSVDLQLAEAADRIVEQVQLPPEARQNLFIAPRLVCREKAGD